MTGPGAILAVPLGVWLVRRLLGRLFPKSRLWGKERPALETWTAILAFAPVVGWLGNPAWWRETLPRLAHYYTLSNQRRGALPDIQIIYFGQVYEYSLPWHNAWVLLGITVPVAVLGAAAIGLLWAIKRIARDRLPLYFLIHLITLPVIRMFDTPAHDGVRLFLPAFFFLAAFAGLGSDLVGRSSCPGGAGAIGGAAAGGLGNCGRFRGGGSGGHPSLRALLLQRVDRRAARGLGARVRAELLVRRVQPYGDPGAERQAAARG